MANEQKKPWYKKTLVLVSIGAGFIGLSTLGYFLYKRSKDNVDDSSRTGKTDSGIDEFDAAAGTRAAELPSPDYSASSSYSLPASSGFPLKRGSRGEMVKNLQNAIIAKYGASALPRYGADGDWGSETQKFFESHPELKSVIDNTTYTDYVTGNFSTSPTKNNPPPRTTASSNFIIEAVKSVIPSWITNPYIKVGWQLFDTAKKKDISNTIALLQKLNNTNDYSSASEGFQLRPWELPLRRFTLVSGLFDAFKGANEQKLIREQLVRMGLKNSDPVNYSKAWTLSGTGSKLRTRMQAIITDGFDIRAVIPTRSTIGTWLSSGNGYTRFRTFDGRTMYVRTNAVVLE